MQAVSSDKYRMRQVSPNTRIRISAGGKLENGVQSFVIRLYKEDDTGYFEVELSYEDTCDLVGSLGMLLGMADNGIAIV